MIHKANTFCYGAHRVCGLQPGMKIVRVCIGPDHIVDSIKTVTSNRVEFQNTGWDMLSWVLDHDFLAEDWDDGVDTSQLNGIPNFITLVILCF